jgi:arsenate reductase (glutaredoxin)
MTTEIWGLPTCDTCRKARSALPDARFRDIRAEPLSSGEISALLDRFGDAAVNRASTTWRGLSEGDRQASPADLLARHPALMKRPVILRGAEMHIGFTPAVRAALGLA